jgi:hypothetical protein
MGSAVRIVWSKSEAIDAKVIAVVSHLPCVCRWYVSFGTAEFRVLLM